jgi:hypothetical protein
MVLTNAQSKPVWRMGDLFEVTLPHVASKMEHLVFLLKVKSSFPEAILSARYLALSKVLLKHGADFIRKDLLHRTLLDVARTGYNWEVVELLHRGLGR